MAELDWLCTVGAIPTRRTHLRKTSRQITFLILDQRIHSDADHVNVRCAVGGEIKEDQSRINVHLRIAISRRDDLFC